jgi:hypothetical protein
MCAGGAVQPAFDGIQFLVIQFTQFAVRVQRLSPVVG